MTFHLMIIQHNNTFGYKRLCGSGIIVQTKSRHTDRWTDRHSDAKMPPLAFVGGGGAGITKRLQLETQNVDEI